MINAADLVKKFEYVLSLGAGYIYGASGQTWTQAKQNAATRSMTVKHGAKWIGKRVWDCSGMFSWTFRELGGYCYHGSNTIWESFVLKSARGKLIDGRREDSKPLKAGTAVFLVDSAGCRHHVGLYIGNGYCIEAKGTAYGVVKSKITHWHEYGELIGVDYANAAVTEESGAAYMETLKAGSRGENVRTAQALLNVWAQDVGGVAITEDGAFGTATKAAVMAFQSAKALMVDGIIGTQTWAALQGLPDAEPDNTDEGEAEPDGEAETDKFDRVKEAIKSAQDALKTAQSVIAAMEAKS